MNKLYALYFVESETHFGKFVAASNETVKLQNIVPNSGGWYTGSNLSSDKRIFKTEEGKYPFYYIAEIPYVC